jgi:hypothetical protein
MTSPQIPIEKQNPYHLLHCQCIRPPEPKSFWPSKAPEGYTFWTNHWQGPECVIFGHSVVERPLVTPHALGIDTGAVHGRSLTALILPCWEIVSVPSRKDYFGPKGVRRYPIHGDVACLS